MLENGMKLIETYKFIQKKINTCMYVNKCLNNIQFFLLKEKPDFYEPCKRHSSQKG